MKKLFQPVNLFNGKITILFLFHCFIYSQNLILSWEKYSAVDAQRSQTIFQENQYLEKQTLLQEEIEELHKSISWYNGWYTKMLLSQKSETQLELADSIQSIQTRIENLTHARQDLFNNLINTYHYLLLDSVGEKSDLEKQHALILGRWLRDRPKEDINLPDYSHIMLSSYDDAGVKNIVLNDMKILLKQKLFLIDLLLNERRLENDLSDRLSKFHQDLGLQMESDVNVIITGENRAFDVGYTDDITSTNEEIGYGLNIGFSDENLSLSSGFNPLIKSGDRYEQKFVWSSSPRSLAALESKRLQYEQLLNKIEEELDQ